MRPHVIVLVYTCTCEKLDVAAYTFFLFNAPTLRHRQARTERGAPASRTSNPDRINEVQFPEPYSLASSDRHSEVKRQHAMPKPPHCELTSGTTFKCQAPLRIQHKKRSDSTNQHNSMISPQGTTKISERAPTPSKTCRGRFCSASTGPDVWPKFLQPIHVHCSHETRD